jgi:hypothetical protein
MPESDHLVTEDAEQLAAEPNAITERSSLIRLDWESLLRRSRRTTAIHKMSPDQRRLLLSNVVGYLGRARASRPHQIANISVGGFCLLSDEPWAPGTEMPITLQREEWDGDDSPERITVQAVVVRRELREAGIAQVGFSIVLAAEECAALLNSPGAASWVGMRTMKRFLDDLRKPKPSRMLPESLSSEARLSLVDRTERLLELARSHRVSVISENVDPLR